MSSRLQKFALVLGAGLLAGSLGACSATPSPQQREAGTASVETGHWPHTFNDATGTAVKLPAKPERIVSTSVSLTGSLLALEAPVVASATAANGPATDADGFLKQWAGIAADRNVDPLHEIGKFNLEDIAEQEPDLIVVAVSGADSEIDQLDQLRAIAPTVAVDYAGKDWTELSEDLGRATGTEERAAQNAELVAQRAAALRETLALPPGTTASIVSYNPGGISPVAKDSGPHAKLFAALGFDLAGAAEKFDTSTQPRDDFSFSRYEDLPETASGDAVFLLSAETDDAEAFTSDASLAQLPAVRNGDVFALGESFLLDFYSAQEILDYFEEEFPGLDAAAR